MRYATLQITLLHSRHLKSARTSFSLSPTHVLVRVDEDMLKKYAVDSVATAFANIVFPVPGGPKSRMPFGGARRPLNKSGRFEGRITVYGEHDKNEELRKELSSRISFPRYLPTLHLARSDVKEGACDVQDMSKILSATFFS